MRRSLIKMEFYETYYFANIIHNILMDPYPYIRNIHDWYEDEEIELLLPPFPRRNRLQQYCEFVIRSLIFEEVSEKSIGAIIKDSDYEVWIDRALKYHGLKCEGFRHWLRAHSITYDSLTEDHLWEYHNDQYLAGELTELVEQLSDETFHVLFSNRKLLAYFNELLARTFMLYFDEEIPQGTEGYFDRVGKLKRVSLPEWVKRAVYYRDRGMCASCNRDLSGLVASQPNKHFDHIVPLALGGLNDVTNIQLLCEQCNLEKSSKPYKVSDIYESWY